MNKGHEEMKDQKEKDEKSLENLVEASFKFLKKADNNNNKITKKMEKLCKEVYEITKQAEFISTRAHSQMESFEESLLYILHNIKKNQFLYSHYPDEWVKNYTSLKQGLKEENKFMQNQGASS